MEQKNDGNFPEMEKARASVLERGCKALRHIGNSDVQRNFSELYDADSYPAMSHPCADPEVNRAVARGLGLDVVDIPQAKILEIGCGTGHHVLSLASRWPELEFVGLDISARCIKRAKNLAAQAGIGNVTFHAVSVLDFKPEEKFDFIIAHGVFSWVPDEVKVGLMDFIGKHLTATGIAVVSFNVAAGWKDRMKVVRKVEAIKQMGDVDEMTALTVYRDAAEESEISIIDDMLVKGPRVLAYDDFGPVMDPWSLGAVVKLAELSGLKWLGDSVTGERGNDREDEERKQTFRSELFCRRDAVLGEPSTTEKRSESNYKVPDFPKLNPWRLVCAREALPVVDNNLVPCEFPFSQLKVLAAMNGSMSVLRLAEYAKEVSPELDFVPWLKYVTERGFFS